VVLWDDLGERLTVDGLWLLLHFLVFQAAERVLAKSKVINFPLGDNVGNDSSHYPENLESGNSNEGIRFSVL
jgi:hypothetical protein